MTVYKNGYAQTKCGCACSAPVVMAASLENTVVAGRACETPCTDISEIVGVGGMNALAQLMFPIQEYTYGFCPSDALAQGTLFPELVR